MFRRTALFLALTAALAVPAAAQAGQPFTIAEGSAPHLTTDPSNGTAHVVWRDEVAAAVRYCRVPRGATGCQDEETLAPVPGVTGYPDRPYLLQVGETQLYVVMPLTNNGRTYFWGSSDSGLTWSDASQIHGPVPEMLNPTSEPVALSPASIIFASQGRVVWRAQAGDPGQTGRAVLPGTGGYDFAVARIPGGSRIVAAGNDLTTTQVWSTAGGEPREPGSWSGPTTLPGELDSTRLAGGSSGAFLLGSAGSAADPRQELRRWSAGGTGFEEPVVLAREIGYINDVTVGPSGAVAAIWRRNEPSNGNRLQMALSAGGAPPFALSTIAREDVVMADMDVSLAGDNAGWAVYEGEQTPATNAKRFIRLATTETVPEPPVTPPPGGSTTTTTPAPPPFVPPGPPPTVPPAPTALLRRTAAVKGATLTLAVPRACIPPGRPFVATLSWKKQRRKGNLFVKVRRVDFIVGSARAKIDRKAPFRQTLRIPSPRAGQTYRLRARAYIKMRRGRSPKKSIVTTLKVCG